MTPIRPARIYKVINAGALLGPDADSCFAEDAAPGEVVTVVVNGRPVETALLDYLVDDDRHGRVLAAEFLGIYL
ncbi:hypothetical protein ACIP9H_34075 [Streptomyces sp. NPDC088732]|uniref:hypothetical protein n=1 Tax=Streptomyces sp. NPDC088732 TaxID=3365879 RepID=UPI00380DE420